MKERVLHKRRKKAGKGRRIAISDELYNYLQARRLNRRRQSFDQYLRRTFGLDDRKTGEPTRLIEGWLEAYSGQFYLRLDEAKGAAVLESVRRQTKYMHPIRMREVV